MVDGGVSNQVELGRVLGISQQAVSKLVKRADWPVRRRGPWSGEDVSRVRAWHRGGAVQEDHSAGMRGDSRREAGGFDWGGVAGVDEAAEREMAAPRKMKLQAETALKTQQAQMAKLKREVFEQERVTRTVFEGGLGGLAEAFREMLEGLRSSLPTRCPGLDRAVFDEALDAGLERILSRAQHELRSLDDVMGETRKRRRGRPAGGGG